MPFTANNTTKIKQFRRDISAVLSCPTLTLGVKYQIDNEWLEELRKHASIPSYEAYNGNQRLGFYYQWLWLKIINAHSNYELIAEEIQLQWDNKTVGAIDFLVKNKKSNELEHWEVAIKFYLEHQGNWIGPNAKDQLDRKINRMSCHQLELSHHNAYRTQYNSIYGQPAVKRLIMQGRRFNHDAARNHQPSIEINPNSLTGKWCFQAEAKVMSSNGIQLRELIKQHWISPPAYEELTAILNTASLVRPTQAISPDNQVWFIVPNEWPWHKKTP
jgi:uncharacterized protein